MMGNSIGKKRIASTAIVLGLCSIFVKITAFARDIVLSYVYGAGTVSDAYLVAVSIPMVLFTGILTALYTSYIPMYHEIKVEDKKRINLYTSNLINIILIVSVAFIIFFWVFADPFVYLFAPGFEKDAFELTVQLSKISIVSIVFMGILYVFQGYLQANNRFYLVALFLVPVNMIVAIAIVLSDKWQNKMLMTEAVVLAYMVVIPVFWYQARKNGFSYVAYLDFRDKYLKRTIMVVLPIFVGQMLAEINNIVDKNMASRLPGGYVTSLDYGFKVGCMVHSVLAWPIATMIFPQLSQYLSEGKIEESKKVIQKSLSIMTIVIIPAVTAVSILATPIIEFLFYRGEFKADNVEVTAQALAIYVISSLPVAYRVIFEKVYFAMKDMKRPIIFSAVGIVVNVILDILLLNRFAHKGLAFATVMSCAVTSALYIIWMVKTKMKGLFGSELRKTIGNTIIATVIMACVLLAVKNKMYVGITGNQMYVMLELFILGIAGAGAYVLTWMMLRYVSHMGECNDKNKM